MQKRELLQRMFCLSWLALYYSFSSSALYAHVYRYTCDVVAVNLPVILAELSVSSIRDPLLELVSCSLKKVLGSGMASSIVAMVISASLSPSPYER